MGLEVILVADPDILKKGRKTMYKFRRHLSQAHIKKPHCTCFIQENATHWKKNLRSIGATAPAPFESPLVLFIRQIDLLNNTPTIREDTQNPHTGNGRA